MAVLFENPSRVYDLYDQALIMCTHHNFVTRAATILSKRASYGLEHGMLEVAINDADNCITTDPDYLEVNSLTYNIILSIHVDGGSTYA